MPALRPLRALPALVLAALLLLVVPSLARADVSVYFLQGEQVASVQRPGTTAFDATKALLAGPTPEELRQGFRSYVPRGTALRSVSVKGGIATVDLTLPFVSDDTDADSLRARVTQLVYTLTGPEGATSVSLLVNGGTPLGVIPGVATSQPLTRAYLENPQQQAPPLAPPKEPSVGQVRPKDAVRAAQARLITLGYLLPGQADGQNGPQTQAAVMAFQKWEGLQRDGRLGPATYARLKTAKRPTPVQRGSGKRAEVLLDKQVALAIRGNRVVRVIHVSTGAAATPTRPGNFKVYGQYARWWSVPFQEYLLWASPFDGGIAFHQYPDVPPFPASHGCVRITAAQAQWMYGFLKVGTPVAVISRS